MNQDINFNLITYTGLILCKSFQITILKACIPLKIDSQRTILYAQFSVLGNKSLLKVRLAMIITCGVVVSSLNFHPIDRGSTPCTSQSIFHLSPSSILNFPPFPKLAISELWWLQEVHTFEFHQPVFKKVTQAGLNILQQKRC